ncbi:hypothetical protein MPSEU_000403800 [Mayamaea pseudoterrestris]|nr:hypothetical protein MPSEU_000403800 [Mayamaea pseudoterrestris]
MKTSCILLLTLTSSQLFESSLAFVVSSLKKHHANIAPNSIASSSPSTTTLAVSIGLGPSKEEEQSQRAGDETEFEYEIPNHEEYRLSRRTKLDQACDEWYEGLLQTHAADGILKSLAQQTRTILETPVELVNDLEKDTDDVEWTPYVTTKLPWTPLVPSFGLEQFGIPTPRRNAETWRQFDVPGMIAQDYSQIAEPIEMSSERCHSIQQDLLAQGGWLDDDECAARLVYVNGYYVDELSKPSEHVYNIQDESQIAESQELTKYLARLTDGFTDELACPVANGESTISSFEKLSGPNHNVGAPTSQFAINTQQGTACFAALNTIKARAVAFVSAPAGAPLTEEEKATAPLPKPVLIINTVTPSLGLASNVDNSMGASLHPRTLIVANEHSRLSVVQSTVDLTTTGNANDRSDGSNPKLYNGYTQVFLKAGANVTHSYLEESGGMVTAGVELSDDELSDESVISPRVAEADRSALKDTHLEAIDVHCMGQDADYRGTVMSVGGSGRVRIGVSATLLHSGTRAEVNGFSLSGGSQRTDMKTNIHHIAQATVSRQTQKNMVGGRSTGSFRGRIRVEQSAQQTDSQQLSRTVLLSDKARAWSVPSLEIIADDVKCAHGTTVSDLSEEELFYLRARGLDRQMARNLLMYAFAGDIASCVEPAMLGALDSQQGLQKRLIRRLENLVPQGDRAVKGEYQSI